MIHSMGNSFHYLNAGEALYDLTDVLYDHGEMSSPRGQATRELRNTTIVIEDSTDVLCTGMNRKMNLKLAAFEALQLIGGFTDPNLMTKIAPNTAQFIDKETRQFHGAYGPRLAGQVVSAINRLQKDPDTRQAILSIWDPRKDLHYPNVDLPCTIGMNLAIRNNQLLMSTHMRSNDIWWGFTYDVVQFTQLQWSIANLFGIEAGPYVHYVDSLHLYERDLDAMSLLRKRQGEKIIHLSGIAPASNDWWDTMDRASALAYRLDIETDDQTESWFNTTMTK